MFSSIHLRNKSAPSHFSQVLFSILWCRRRTILGIAAQNFHGLRGHLHGLGNPDLELGLGNGLFLEVFLRNPHPDWDKVLQDHTAPSVVPGSTLPTTYIFTKKICLKEKNILDLHNYLKKMQTEVLKILLSASQTSDNSVSNSQGPLF